jgi:DNA polymerase I-like protein with 3'-5' exonuclease and polymerase domains
LAYSRATQPSQVYDFVMQAEGVVSHDLETTGLDTRRAKIVGHSFSVASGDALYAPVGHTQRTDQNIDGRLVADAFMRAVEEKHLLVAYFNAKFDLNIFHAFAGTYPKNFVDVLELVYLKNPDRKRKDLKLLASEDLGVELAKYDSLFTSVELKAKKTNIAAKSPDQCVHYACGDADMTFRLWKMYEHVFHEQKFAVKVDTRLVEIVRRIEHNGGMELNLDYIQTEMDKLLDRGEVLKKIIFELVGRTFEISSPKQLADVLFVELGYPSQGMTKGGQHKTGAVVLDFLAKTYPVAEFIVSYRKVVKAASSYLGKLMELGRLGMRPRFSYNMYSAPTFRFAAPGGNPLKDGFCGVNIQAVSNGESRDVWGVDLDQVEAGAPKEDWEDVQPDDALVEVPVSAPTDVVWTGDVAERAHVIPSEGGHNICISPSCHGCPVGCHAKGVDVTRRTQKGLLMVPSVRNSFMAPDGWTILSFDYKRQEMVIGANLSKEPRWVQAFLNDEDLHLVTTCNVYGLSAEAFFRLSSPEQTRKRDIGKMLNFAIFYGATEYTISTRAQISIENAKVIYEGFFRAYPRLQAWIREVRVFARRNGYTTTYFGRKRYLKQYYEGDRQLQAFADRSAVNTAIQGTGAEVTRIAMVKVDAALKKAGYTPKEAKFAMQLHDELSFLVRNELVAEVAALIRGAMEFNVKSWDVQLSVAAKVGKIWGAQDKFKLAV